MTGKAIRRFTAEHRTVTVLIATLLPVLLRLILLPYLPIPEPEVHDEFSYLLGADTLAAGRLTNPPHPMWVHFETFHVNQQPTYATKYPPGQPLFLAFGQRFLGHPWYGVVLGIGLMCGCICWMLQGWLPPSYALLGGIFAAVRFGVISYWMNSYWGGGLPAAGGALVLGALPRLARRSDPLTAALGALGMVLLAFTRPFEGFILTGASAIVLLFWLRHEGRSLRLLLTTRLVIPAGIILAVAFLWMGYYNYRVTGSPWLMPFVVHQRMYAATPHFWFLPAGQSPSYRHEVIRRLWAEWDRDYYVQARSNPFRLVPQFVFMVLYSLWTPFRLCLLIGVVLARTRKVRIALTIAGVLAVALLMEKSVSPHYYAPAVGLLIFLIIAGWRYVLRTAGTRSTGFRKGVVLLFAGSILYSFLDETLTAVRQPSQTQFAVDRREIVDRLSRDGRRHVIIVRYAPDHDIHSEWVQNRADIDASSIVWARDMGETVNRELVEYYRKRKAWLLEPDVRPPRLTELPGNSTVF